MRPVVRSKKTGHDRPGGLGLPRAAAASAVLLALAWGCGGLLSNDPPERVTADITSAATDSVLVVTSTAFVLTDQGGDELLDSDTVVVDLPYHVETDITSTRRFLIKVYPGDSVAADTMDFPVNLRVQVDGEVRFDRESDVSETPLEFRYLFAGS